MCLKFVSKHLVIPLRSGYNVEFFIEFFRKLLFEKKIVLKQMIYVDFVRAT